MSAGADPKELPPPREGAAPRRAQTARSARWSGVKRVHSLDIALSMGPFIDRNGKIRVLPEVY